MKIPSQEKAWNLIAEKWNNYRTKIPPTVENFLKKQKGKILDVGCGSGRHFIKRKNLEFYGIDFSKEMLKHAKGKNIARELIKSNSWKIPYESNFFDAVLCYAVLHCISSKHKRQNTIKEIYRTLKPKSQALISVWGRNSPRLKNKPKECFVPWTTKENEKTKRYTYIYNFEELKAEIENAGFRIVNIWQERNINVIVEKSNAF